MNFRRQKLSDDEFVERIRRQTRVARKAAAALSVGSGIILTVLLYHVPRFAYSTRNLTPDASAYDQGFAFGLFLGTAAAILFVFLIWHLIHFLMMAFGLGSFRIYRLLLQYHDIASQHGPAAKTNDG